MKCDCKCGMVDNPKYTCSEDYFFGINPIIKCKKCKGFGFVVSEPNEILQELKSILIGLKQKEKSNYEKRIENIIDIIEFTSGKQKTHKRHETNTKNNTIS